MTIAPSIHGATIGINPATAGLPSVLLPGADQGGSATQGPQRSGPAKGPPAGAIQAQQQWRSMLASAGVSTEPGPALPSPAGAGAYMPARSAPQAHLQQASGAAVATGMAAIGMAATKMATTGRVTTEIRSSTEADPQRAQVEGGDSKHAKVDRQKDRGHEKEPKGGQASAPVAVAHPQGKAPEVAPLSMPVVSPGQPAPATPGLWAKGETSHSSAGLQPTAGSLLPNDKIAPSDAGHLAWAPKMLGLREAVVPGTTSFVLPPDAGQTPAHSPVAAGEARAIAEGAGAESLLVEEGVRPVLAPSQQASAATAAPLAEEQHLPASPWITQGMKMAADQPEVSAATAALKNAPDGSQALSAGDFTNDAAAYAAGGKSSGSAAPVPKPGRPNLTPTQVLATATVHSVGPVAAAATAIPMGHGPMTLTGEAGRGADATATSGSNAPASAQETFAALDAGTGVAAVSWTHASARQAEAGYQDPALGWVSVRAQSNMDGIHAALVPGSVDAAQSLSGHLAGLNAYLSDRQTQVESLRVAPPESHWVGQGTGQGTGQGAGQGAGQETSQSGGQSHGQAPGQQSNQDIYAERQSGGTTALPAVGGVVSAPRSQAGSGLETQAGLTMGGGTYVSVMA